MLSYIIKDNVSLRVQLSPPPHNWTSLTYCSIYSIMTTKCNLLPNTNVFIPNTTFNLFTLYSIRVGTDTTY